MGFIAWPCDQRLNANVQCAANPNDPPRYKATWKWQALHPDDKPASRLTVAETLRRFMNNNGTIDGVRHRVHIGVTGMGTVKRGFTGSLYERALTGSKVIVTCQPPMWEGDGRTMEALASGAVVLVDRMHIPPPGVRHNHSVLFYNSTAHLLELLSWVLHNPSQADRIARRGVAATITTTDLADYMIRVVLRRSALRVPVRLFVTPVPASHAKNEYQLMVDGFRRSHLVELQQPTVSS